MVTFNFLPNFMIVGLREVVFDNAANFIRNVEKHARIF